MSPPRLHPLLLHSCPRHHHLPPLLPPLWLLNRIPNLPLNLLQLLIDILIPRLPHIKLQHTLMRAIRMQLQQLHQKRRSHLPHRRALIRQHSNGSTSNRKPLFRELVSVKQALRI